VSPEDPSTTELEASLARPPSERVREYKYRFAQTVVFGLPVLALQQFGVSLGGAEAGRWVAVLQALLAGWVMYVAAGMLFETLLLLARGQFSPDLPAVVAALGLYLTGLCSAVALLFRVSWVAPTFHWAVLVLGLWTGIRWWALAKRSTPDASAGRAVDPAVADH
jgi:hypothetical protein